MINEDLSISTLLSGKIFNFAVACIRVNKMHLIDNFMDANKTPIQKKASINHRNLLFAAMTNYCGIKELYFSLCALLHNCLLCLFTLT
jgi:hypothetical protein